VACRRSNSMMRQCGAPQHQDSRDGWPSHG
jgi:hypothetical protein